jgi:hypothetical protein
MIHSVRYALACALAALLLAFVPSTRAAVAQAAAQSQTIAAPAARVGVLLDTLASADDKFWPHENWPGVKFNLPLQVGVTGEHGTGPYTVSSYTPGRHIRFEFGGDLRLGNLRFARRRKITFRLGEVAVAQQMSQCILQIRHGDRCRAADPRRNRSPRNCSSHGGDG